MQLFLSIFSFLISCSIFSPSLPAVVAIASSSL